jgi:PilZ domain-containing protein
MNERRRASRMIVDLGVFKRIDGETYTCRACEISASGIRLTRMFDLDHGEKVVEIELPLVEGNLTTQISARRVWRREGYEAFEFVGASYAQQAMLERIFGNY